MGMPGPRPDSLVTTLPPVTPDPATDPPPGPPVPITQATQSLAMRRSLDAPTEGNKVRMEPSIVGNLVHSDMCSHFLVDIENVSLPFPQKPLVERAEKRECS